LKTDYRKYVIMEEVYSSIGIEKRL